MSMRGVCQVAILAVLGLVPGTLSACSRESSRERARGEFVDQLVEEGGLPRDVAVCVVDRFFAERSDEELKAFFEREDLTDAEQVEFAKLGEECAPATT